MPFFSPSELQCRCSRPECDAPPMRPGFMAKLERLRELWGALIVVTSGSRCAYWNEHVGGEAQSQHMLGNAADLRVTSILSRESLAAIADKVGMGGVGKYDTWVHVDDGPPGRRWTRTTNK